MANYSRIYKLYKLGIPTKYDVLIHYLEENMKVDSIKRVERKISSSLIRINGDLFLYKKDKPIFKRINASTEFILYPLLSFLKDSNYRRYDADSVLFNIMNEVAKNIGLVGRISTVSISYREYAEETLFLSESLESLENIYNLRQ